MATQVEMDKMRVALQGLRNAQEEIKSMVIVLNEQGYTAEATNLQTNVGDALVTEIAAIIVAIA